MRRVERPGVRAGYDRWAQTYDATPNPVVALDRQHTLSTLRPRRGETILDAGCGTGAQLRRMREAGARPVGLDFSLEMLRVAQRRRAGHLAQADLNDEFPVRPRSFDALVSSLVSEHLTNLEGFFAEVFAALRPGGRFVFSAFHPEPALGGIEANFEQDGTEYRLGAEPYTTEDYLDRIANAGLDIRDVSHHGAGPDIVDAAKYEDVPLLLLVEAVRPA